MRIPEGFHVDGGSADAFGLTAEEVAEERKAAGTPANGKKRLRGPRKAPPVRNPFDEILKSIGLWDRVKAVCNEHGVAPVELGEAGRTQRVITAKRKVYLMLKEIGWSASDIGRLFNRDHTSVLALLK